MAESDGPIVRVNTEFRGDVAKAFLELERRGRVKKYSEAVAIGVMMFFKEVLEEERLKMQLDFQREHSHEDRFEKALAQ